LLNRDGSVHWDTCPEKDNRQARRDSGGGGGSVNLAPVLEHLGSIELKLGTIFESLRKIEEAAGVEPTPVPTQPTGPAEPDVPF